MREMKEILSHQLKKENDKVENKLDIQESCTICLDEFDQNENP
jgi:hypothetical protein